MEHSLNQRKSVTTNGTRYRISKPRDCSHHGHTEILVTKLGETAALGKVKKKKG